MKLPLFKGKGLTLSIFAILALVSCSKDSDLFDGIFLSEPEVAILVTNYVVDDIYITNGNQDIVMDVLSNDVFENPENTVITDISTPNSGDVTINDDNTITYTPDEDAPETDVTDSFTYTTETTNDDQTTNTDEGTVTVKTDFGELRAFPTAEGFGKNATGGRGGEVIQVTNLNDSGAGSLRAAIDSNGSRTIVFKVSGYITLRTPLVVRNGDLTIAGQTAPGEGITLRLNQNTDMACLRIKSSNIIVRGIRFRPGLTSNASINGDALVLTSGENIIIDHCSFSWATDELVNPYGASKITFQNCIFSEGLMFATHKYTTDPNSSAYRSPHSMGMLIGEHSNDITIYNSVFAHNNQRNPLIGGGSSHGTNFELVNNVFYNWGDFGTVLKTGAQSNINIINNLYIKGENSRSTRNPIIIGDKVSVYGLGNINDFRETNDLPEYHAFATSKAPFNIRVSQDVVRSSPFDYPLSDTEQINPQTLLTTVTSMAGAFNKDGVDRRITQDVLNKTGNLINTPSDVGGYPSLASGNSYIDEDGDGMSDSWEIENGLDPTNANDGKEDQNDDGYTNLEDFLHFLTQ